jgi:hypothetical protein
MKTVVRTEHLSEKKRVKNRAGRWLGLRDHLQRPNLVLLPFQNIRCFRFIKQMYLDIF